MPLRFDYASVAGAETEGAVVIVGMPSYGDVGPIAARLLLDHVPQRLAGTFQSDVFPPTAFSWRGVITGPVQVWAVEREGAARLLILNSDVSLHEEDMSAFARAVARWAAERLVGLIVTLEGCPGHLTADGVGVATNVPGEPYAGRVAAKKVHGRLTGFTAALLARTNQTAVPAVGLLAPVEEEKQDAAAAAAALRAAEPLLPAGLLPVDVVKKAEETEEKVRAERQAQRAVERRIRSQFEVSYA